MADISEGHEKHAGALVYLMEELTDARMRCDQLQRYIARAVSLVEKSDHKDHFFEVAGDLLRGIPEVTFKLHKALQATALAAGRMDYEEIKQDLRPEKAEELEKVLQDVRIRPVKRRSTPMKPIDALNALRTLQAKTTDGAFPLEDTLTLISDLETGITKEASTSTAAKSFGVLADFLAHPPEGAVLPQRQRLAQMLRQIVADNIQAEGVSAVRVAKNTIEDHVPQGIKRDLKEAYKAGLESGLDDGKGAVELEFLGAIAETKAIVVAAGRGTPKAFLTNIGPSLWELAYYLGARKGSKTASDDDKQSKFKEGEPADPTENMTPEDAKKWKENVDHDGSNLTKEAVRDDLSKARARLSVAQKAVASMSVSAAEKLMNDARKVYSEAHDLLDDARQGDYNTLRPKFVKRLADLHGGVLQGLNALSKVDSKGADSSLVKNLSMFGHMDLSPTTIAEATGLGQIIYNKAILVLWKAKRAAQLVRYYTSWIEVFESTGQEPSDADQDKWLRTAFDHDGSNLTKEAAAGLDKSARFRGTSDQFLKDMKDTVDDLLKVRVKVRLIQEDLTDLHGDATGLAPFDDVFDDKDIKDTATYLYDLDHLIGKSYSSLEFLSKTLKKRVKTARYEEGESADPTENMTPEDAKKWKENVDHDGSNLKEAKARWKKLFPRSHTSHGHFFDLEQNGYDSSIVPVTGPKGVHQEKGGKLLYRLTVTGPDDKKYTQEGTSIEALKQEAEKRMVQDKTANIGDGVKHLEKKTQGWESGHSEYLTDLARGYRKHFKDLEPAAARMDGFEFDGVSLTKTAASAIRWIEKADRLGKRWVTDITDSNDDVWAWSIQEFQGPGIPLYRVLVITPDGAMLRWKRQVKTFQEATKFVQAWARSAQSGASLIMTNDFVKAASTVDPWKA